MIVNTSCSLGIDWYPLCQQHVDALEVLLQGLCGSHRESVKVHEICLKTPKFADCSIRSPPSYERMTFRGCNERGRS
ncbi:unnamed protein product [Sphagnum jensenii]|uniref:Uncharacterized protein n=1 Tax=Sphagnum jensenii TaxID=128206 RepID=A0ABP1BLH8_9BRYO